MVSQRKCCGNRQNWEISTAFSFSSLPHQHIFLAGLIRSRELPHIHYVDGRCGASGYSLFPRQSYLSSEVYDERYSGSARPDHQYERRNISSLWTVMMMLQRLGNVARQITTHQPCTQSPKASLFDMRLHSPSQYLFRVTSYSSSTSTADSTSDREGTSDVIICGGGIIGVSVAYHLSKLHGAKVTLLEQGSLSCGTTWHAAGLIGKMRPTLGETKLSDYGSKLYSKLEEETGCGTGWRQCGSITVGRTEDRMRYLQRSATKARAFGIKAEIVGVERIKQLWPLMETSDLKGGLWLPEDGVATSSDLCQALAKGAKMHGATIRENARVVKVVTENDGMGLPRVEGVLLESGEFVSCGKAFVNCGGQWAHAIGNLSSTPVSVPLHSAEHFYIVTKPIDGISPDLPVMRDPDGYTYYREWSGGLIMGGFEPVSKPCFTDGIPHPFEYQLLPDDWDHFDILMQEALLRVPVLENTEVEDFRRVSIVTQSLHEEVRSMVNGPESFTPDMAYILGRTPEIGNYFVAAGFNSSGIASSAGAGLALAEWIWNGEPSLDLAAVDIRRFHNFQHNREYLRERTSETLGLHYQIPWPRREMETARGVRRSALYHPLNDRGAVWGSKFGWERVNYFIENGRSDVDVQGVSEKQSEYLNQRTFDRPKYFDIVEKEVRATRESVCLFDQSSFAKYEVAGKDALNLMQLMCSTNMDTAVGSVSYTLFLNDEGGIESDVSVTRLEENRFFVTSSTALGTRDMDWMRRTIHRLGLQDSVHVHDVTSSYGVIGLQGPLATDVLRKAGSNRKDQICDDFLPRTSRSIEVGQVIARAQRFSYVGVDGYELIVPTEMMEHAYEAIVKAGDGAGLRHGGYFAIEALRVEIGQKAWGHELSPAWTPLESGVGFAVDMQKEDFAGKKALEKSTSHLRHRTVYVKITNNDIALPWGGEAIMFGDEIVGWTSSAGYAFGRGCGVGLGRIDITNIVSAGGAKSLERALKDNREAFLLDIDGKKVSCELSLRAPPL